MTEFFFKRIGDLIGKDELQQAINELKIFLKKSTKLDELIIQSARYNDVMKGIRLGTLKVEDAEISKNNIRYAILDLLREIEESTEKNDVYLSEANSSLESIYSEKLTEGSSQIGLLNQDGKVKIKSSGDIAFRDIIKNEN